MKGIFTQDQLALAKMNFNAVAAMLERVGRCRSAEDRTTLIRAACILREIVREA
jgi:hypothetical protein